MRRHLEAQARRARHDRGGASPSSREQGYLDDARFAQRFAEDRRTLDAWGAERIERRLRALGVAPRADRRGAGRRRRATTSSRPRVALLRRRFPVAARRPTASATARSGFLVRKGYELELAYDAVRALRPQRSRSGPVSPEGLGVDRITTARLAGRRPEADDLGAYMDFFCDPRIEEELWPSADAHARARAGGPRRPHRPTGTAGGSGRGPCCWAAGSSAGAGSATRRSTAARRSSCMWFMHPDHWRHGYSTEIAREAVRVAFEVLELDDVVAFTTTGNVASRTVMDKLGMAYEADIEHVGMPHVLYRLKR